MLLLALGDGDGHARIKAAGRKARNVVVLSQTENKNPALYFSATPEAVGTSVDLEAERAAGGGS